MGSKTRDHSFKHIKGIKEEKKQPFLKVGLFFGIILLLAGLSFPFLFVIGAILIVLAFWYRTHYLVVYHIDGNEIEIPQIKSETGVKLAQILRTKLYDND